MLEFPCDIDPDLLESLLEDIAEHADNIITTHNSRVVGAYEEDYT